MPTATTASAFLASIGVNTAMDYTDTTYANVTMVVQSLAYLGVSLVRDHIPATDAASLAPYLALAAAGIRFDFLFPGGALNLTANMQALNTFAKDAPGAIAAVEGPNEVNLWPVSYNGQGGLAGAAAEQKAIYAAVHADATLAGIPVYALTLGGGSASQERALGNLSAYADYGNAHVYPDSGAPPNPNWLTPWLASQSVPTGSDPMVLTEFGYTTAVNSSSGERVPLDVQAKQDLDVLFDAWKAGVKTTYLYELMASPDPGLTDDEADYGLFNADGTPKPAATAIHNTTAILADNGTGGVALGALNYSVSNLPSTGNTLLLEKSNGTFDIVLWNEPVLWNAATRSENTIATTSVTVNLGGTFASVSLFDPLVGTAAVQTFTNVSQVQVGLSDHPLFLQVSPGVVTGSAATSTVATGLAAVATPTSTGSVQATDLVPGSDVIQAAQSITATTSAGTLDATTAPAHALAALGGSTAAGAPDLVAGTGS